MESRTATSITCACPVEPGRDNGSRRKRRLSRGLQSIGSNLTEGDLSYSASYAAMLRSTHRTFTATWESSTSLSASVVARSRLVLIAILVLIFVSLLCLIAAHVADERQHIVEEGDQIGLSVASLKRSFWSMGTRIGYSTRRISSSSHKMKLKLEKLAAATVAGRKSEWEVMEDALPEVLSDRPFAGRNTAATAALLAEQCS